MQNTMEAVIVRPNCLLPPRMMADDDQVRTVIQSVVNWRNAMLHTQSCGGGSAPPWGGLRRSQGGHRRRCAPRGLSCCGVWVFSLKWSLVRLYISL